MDLVLVMQLLSVVNPLASLSFFSHLPPPSPLTLSLSLSPIATPSASSIALCFSPNPRRRMHCLVVVVVLWVVHGCLAGWLAARALAIY